MYLLDMLEEWLKGCLVGHSITLVWTEISQQFLRGFPFTLMTFMTLLVH